MSARRSQKPRPAYRPVNYEELYRQEMSEALALGKVVVQRDKDRARYPGLAKELSKAGFTKEKIYLRMGDLPRGGLSENGPLFERGISCIAGRRTKEGHYILVLVSLVLRAELIRLFEHENRPAYFVRGRTVVGGRGGAQEPLLRSVSRIEPVPPACIVTVDPASYAVDTWNTHRGGRLEDRPELANYFRERVGER